MFSFACNKKLSQHLTKYKSFQCLRNIQIHCITDKYDTELLIKIAVICRTDVLFQGNSVFDGQETGAFKQNYTALNTD